MAVRDTTPGVVLSREQVAQIAYQAGARGEDLAFLVGIPQGESAYRPGMHRTDRDFGALSGDRGLYQINYIWDQQLMAAGIIRQKSDLFDPLTNARAAVYVLQHQGRNAWMAFDGSMSGNDRVNWGAARAAVQNAANRGMLGQDWQAGATSGSGGSQGASAASDDTGTPNQGPIDLPRDARVAQFGTMTVAVFELQPGVSIYYQIQPGSVNPGGAPVTRFADKNAFFRRYKGAVNGGDAEELRTVRSDFGTFKAWFNTALDTVMPKSNPARNDGEVLRVFAEYAGRPDMTAAELQNKLHATKWFQSRTEAELEFNDLSQAERNKRTKDTRSRMNAAALELVGIRPYSVAGTPGAEVWNRAVKDYVDAVTSGKMGFGEWTETVLKPFALTVAESPWARSVRDIEESGRQRGIDTENTSQRIREELERYGLRWDTGTLTRWAEGMVEKRFSDEDLVKTLEAQAQALYPGLGPLNGQDVATVAAPWLETAERVLEKKATIFDPRVRSALAQGLPVWDFEVQLTKTPEWMKTRNADERVNVFAAEINEEFGF